MKKANKKVKNWIKSAYGIAKCKGFHDDKHSVAHMLMLVCTEIGEVVDAERKGGKCDTSWYDAKRSNLTPKQFAELYKNRVKESVEAEIADVVIRICDTCGALDIEPFVDGKMTGEWEACFGEMSLCELCFCLTRIVSDVDDNNLYDKINPRSVVSSLGSALDFIISMCEVRGIDIEKHVEMKMGYNAMRPHKNGKKY